MEEWIIDDPDSAMNVLDAIDTTSLCGEEERALYGLLLTMAQEKTNIVVADDSLIQSSARYFEDKGDKRREMIANCYLGMVRYDLERYSEA
ncbi:MAG: tetratricopeptide repeat protein, partial [Muribaculaceae bacterium]|nr:tetratricopeptide repeat protein [Muribaculaceae bacterium]